MKQLWEIIKEKRESLGMTQKELSDKVGCTPMYISRIEMSSENDQRVPSDEVLRKIAKALTTSETERQRFEKLLLIERAKLIVAPEVAKMLDKHIDIDQLSSMPDDFLKRLKEDMQNEKIDIDVLSERTSINKELLKDVLQGNGEIKQSDVITIAKALNQDIEEYLLLSGTIPENVKKFLSLKGSFSLFRSIANLSTSDIEGIIKMFDSIVNTYKEMKRNKK